MNDLPQWAGTIPGWVTAIVSSGGFIAWLKYLLDKKKLEGTRLVDLEKENRALRKDFDDYRRECIDRDEQQRKLIDGLRRQLLQIEVRQFEEIAEKAPPATRARFSGIGND